MQRTLLRRVIQLLAGVMVLWFAVYLALNDRRLGQLVTTILTGSPSKKESGLVRGTFRLGYAHYDYWSSLASIILNTSAPIRGGDYDLLDPDGNLVMHVDEVRADAYIGELIRSLLRTAVSAPFKRGVYIDLHFTRGRIRGGHGAIRLTESTKHLAPEKGEVNIVAAMASKRPSTDPNAPGRLLIQVDGEGADFKDLDLELEFPAWYGRAEGLSGNATLRYSSAAKETLPGKPAFVYEVRPLRARRTHISLGGRGQPGSFAFELSEVDLSRFGARASKSQTLSFRGRAVAEGNAPIELLGGLIDTYCDAGVDLEMSVEHAGLLAHRAWPPLSGQPQGRVRIYGPFSATPPQLPGGKPHPCLSPLIKDRPRAPVGPDGRTVVIEGVVSGVDTEIASIHLSEGQSRLRMVRGVLTLPQATANGLSGTVRVEPLRVDFNKPLRFIAAVRAQGADPAQVKMLPPVLRVLLMGKMNGAARISGGLDDKGELGRVTFGNLDVALSRQHAGDPYPRELALRGDVVYGPAQVGLREIDLTGDGLSLSLPRGTIGLASGRLALGGVEVKGGPQASRMLQRLGLPASLRDLAASLNVGGTLLRPEVSGGTLSVRGLDVAGRRVDDLSSAVTLHEGNLALKEIKAKDLIGGSATGQLNLQLFPMKGGLAQVNMDPGLRLSAKLEKLSGKGLGGWDFLDGQVSAQVELGGSVRRPTGTASVQVPLLNLQGADFRDVVVDLELHHDAVLLNSLYAAVGPVGLINGNAVVQRDGAMAMQVSLNPRQLALRDIPFLRRLPYQLEGDVSGSLRFDGTARPLRPTADGELTLNGFRISGPRLVSEAPPVSPMAWPPPGAEIPAALLLGGVEAQPLFRMLGVAVRTLTLGRAEVLFRPNGDGGTRFRGTFFETFRVEGVVYLDPEDLRGEVHVRFGCPPPQPGTPPPVGACDFAVAKLLPDLRQLGDVEVRTSGELLIRFGQHLPPLAEAVAVRATGVVQTGVQARLHLQRAALTVRTADDEGTEQFYRVSNDGDVVVATDGSSFYISQAHFHSERVTGAAPSLAPNTPLPPDATPGRGPRRTYGEVTLSGWVGDKDSDLHVRGQLGLELLEQLVRSTFKHVVGTVVADLHLRGPRERLVPRGTVDVRGARLLPQDLDVPFDLRSGHVEVQPDRARMRDLLLVVDGAATRADGEVEVRSWNPLRLGRIDFALSGALSGRLLQWRLPRTLSEAGGQLELRGVRLGGTADAPQLSGTVAARDLFLNVRRFHELYIKRGTVRFVSEGPGGPAILFGCGGDRTQRDCVPVEAAVDADGKVVVSGRVAHGGLASLLQPEWYRGLEKVALDISLTNVRQSTNGVYTVEVTTATPLKLLGSRDRLTLSGKVDVVSGRYTRPFNLSDYILRQSVEEELPFWYGDPLLSQLELDLGVLTRGNFQVVNNIADLRLSTTDLWLSGPLSRIAMAGTLRVDTGTFFLPGVRGEFQVRGDSKIEFSPTSDPWVDVRGVNVQFDRNEEQRSVELALRGKLSEAKIECLSSDGMNANDCVSYLLTGVTGDQLRRSLTGTGSGGSAGLLSYSDNAARLLLGQVLTSQVEDPLREKLRLDTVRIQFGVSSFDVQLCKRRGLFLRLCGQAELGLLATSARRYRGFGEVRLSDYLVGELSYDRLERSLESLEDTINRFKLQVGLRRALHF